MDEERPDYLSYLLRLWRVRERGPPDGEPPDSGVSAWRASLQSPGTGERIGFRTLEELFAFLRGQTGTRQGSDAKRDVGPGVLREPGSGPKEIDGR
jgi:hypothetical protein